jgi:hypothetical protein
VAYATFVGVRTALDPEAASRPPLVGRAPAASSGLVTLDGAEVLPLATDGTFRFECVAEGAHIVQWSDAARTVVVQVAGPDTTRVELPPPAP